jgi:hypothetical protein
VDGDTSEFPTAAALRSWGPTDDVFVVYELHDNASKERRLWLQDFRCSTATCLDNVHPYGNTVEAIGDPVLQRQALSPAMSVHRPTGSSPVELDILFDNRGDAVHPWCGDAYTDYDTTSVTDPASPEAEDLDLFHVAWTAGVPPTVSVRHVIEETTADATGSTSVCEDRDRSAVATYGTGRMRGCWRYENAPMGGDDEVHCIDELTPRSDTFGAVRVMQKDDSRDGDQDHTTLELDGTGRWVVHHAKEYVSPGVTNDAIRIQFPDDPAPWDNLQLASGTDYDEPEVAIDDLGNTHVVYQVGVGSTSTIRMRTCPVTQDCRDLSDWGAEETVATGTRLRFPQIVTDYNRQLVVYMEDIDPDLLNQRNRVKLARRCVGGPWLVTEARTIAAGAARENWDQVLFFGKRPVGANRVDNILHVVFVEADSFEQLAGLPSDADLYWGRVEYTDCP